MPLLAMILQPSNKTHILIATRPTSVGFLLSGHRPPWVEKRLILGIELKVLTRPEAVVKAED